MSYKPRGMHAAAEGLESAVRDKGLTVRTILPKGRKSTYCRLLDSWDMTGPTKAVVMPGPKDSPLTPRISRKERISPFTKIAEKYYSPEWRAQTKRLDLHHA
jgi:hypothetical protein